jgi:hypothetical protein
MPYKFGEYVSTYVDPQSVAISETLRNRFMENFKANDQLSMAVEGMKAALPFENDLARKKELETQINEKLDLLSNRGDYENLGFAVHKATKDFSTSYAPIKENYERYQGALKEIDEQFKKGDINAEDYNMATSYITKGYKGFEVDPTTGKAKEGTMFSAPTIYKDPKLMDKMKERLEILYEKTSGGKTGKAGLDANGVWKVTSGEKIVQIPEEDVMDVYNSVIQEPDVRMYLDQRADMKLYMADRSGNTGAYLDAKLKNNQSAIDQINQAIATGKYSAADKKVLGNKITALAEENKKIQTAKSDPNLASTYLKEQFKNELLDPVKEYALKKAGVREHTTEYSYENNYAVQLDAMKRQADARAAMGVPLYEQGDVTAADDISGATPTSKRDYLTGINQQITNLEAEIAAGGMSDQMLNTKKAALASNINERSRVEGQLKAATDKAINMATLEKQDPTLVNAVKKANPNASAGEIYNIIVSKPEALKTAFDNEYGQGAYDNHIRKWYRFESQNRLKQEQGKAVGLYTPASIFKEKFDEQIKNVIPEIKASFLFNAGTIDVGDPEKSLALTKAKNEYFNGKMPFENQIFTVNGEQKTGAELAAEGYVMKGAYPNLQTNLYQIHLEKGGDKPGSITAIYDGRQITSKELRNAMSDPEVRLASLIQQHNTRIAGSVGTIETIKLAGDPIYVNVISRGDGDPYITFTDPETGEDALNGGTPIKYTQDDQVIKNAIAKGWLNF